VCENDANPVKWSSPSMTALAIGGVILVWCSHPAVFVLASIGSVLEVRAAHRKEFRSLIQLALVGAAWLASFATCYFLTLRTTAANDYLTEFWSEHFLPLSSEAPGWLIRAAVLLFDRGVVTRFAD